MNHRSSRSHTIFTFKAGSACDPIAHPPPQSGRQVEVRKSSPEKNSMATIQAEREAGVPATLGVEGVGRAKFVTQVVFLLF